MTFKEKVRSILDNAATRHGYADFCQIQMTEKDSSEKVEEENMVLKTALDLAVTMYMLK